MLLSVDPGKHKHGCALWENGELVRAWWTGSNTSIVDEIKEICPVQCITKVAIEIMQIYAGTGVKKGNDLLAVNFSGGRLVGELRGHLDEVVTYLPRQWKGQVPKDVMNRRIIKTLSIEERTRVSLPTAKSAQHNVWDGAGIGLKYWGRL